MFSEWQVYKSQQLSFYLCHKVHTRVTIFCFTSTNISEVLIYKSQQDARQSLFYLTIALHVSGIIITHIQEHKTTVTTASGNRYTVIDIVKFLLLKSTYRLD
jgi:hypothetical protein